MILQRWRQCIEPMRSAQEIFQVVIQENVFDPKLDDVQVRADRELDFAQNLFGIIRVRGENQNHDFTLLDGAGDFPGERAPGLHIARRHPAANPTILQCRANRIGDRFVLGRVRNENVVRHVRPVAV